MLRNKKVLGFIKIIMLIILSFLTGIGLGVGLKKNDDILGLIGGIIGVMGAFGLYKYQSYKDKKNENDTNFKMVKNILIYTISETDRMIYFMREIYIKLYVSNPKKVDKNSVGYKMLKFNIEGKTESPLITIKYEYDRGTFEGMIESLVLDDMLHSTADSSMNLNKMEKLEFKLIQHYYNKTREHLIKEFRTVEDKKYMIYDKKWCNYIHNIDGLEFEELEEIINWLNIINKPLNTVDDKRREMLLELEQLNKKFESLKKINIDNLNDIEKDEHMLKYEEIYKDISIKQANIKRLKLEVVYHMCEFIRYRDKAINILRNKFKYDQFKTSTEMIKEEFYKL